MQDFLFEWLSGAGAEAAVFASAFISSTLMPGGSEALLAGALSQTPDDTPRLRRWGAPALLLSWLPVVGDALPLAAGCLRMPATSCAVWMAVGKLLRYVVVAAGTLSLV